MTKRNELDETKRSHKRLVANIRKSNRRDMIIESFVLLVLVDFAIERVRVRLGVEGGFSVFHDRGKFLAGGIV
jgi:predicted ABC-type ATPase